MSHSKFTKRRSSLLFKQRENGTSIKDICKKQQISRATFYNWMIALRLIVLEKENKVLKKELSRLTSKKKTSIARPEFKITNENNDQELSEMVSTIIADIILSDKNILSDKKNNLEEFIKQLKSI